MKTPYYLFLGGATLLLSSCGALKNVQKPLSSDGSFDPLTSPGSQKKKSSSSSSSSSFSAPTSVSYTPGQWVETSMPNSTFFSAIPKGNATADKVLQAGVPLKFISSKGSYVKVELDSGQVGYIPEIMVIERSPSGAVTPSAPPLPPVDNTVPTSTPFVPPSVLPEAPVNPADNVLPEIPTIPNESPVIPSAPATPTVPTVPAVPDVPGPSSSTLPEVSGSSSVDLPKPPAVNGITEPSTTD